jgi:hypothetical protein
MEDLIINSKPVGLHKGFKSPDFNSKTVLVRDHWEYVEMYLKRKHLDNAVFYWSQAKEFYKASLDLPNTSSPLTLYYCFLNAAKALLTVKQIVFTERHGVAGQTAAGNTNLENEQIIFHRAGILNSLSAFLEDPNTATRHQFSFKDLLYNLPFIHRAFSLTYATHYPEIYIPIVKPTFLKNRTTRQVFLSFKTSGNYANGHTERKITPLGFTKDQPNSTDKQFQFISNTSFAWSSQRPQRTQNLQALTDFHKQQKRVIQYIFGSNTLWYIKRAGANHTIDKHPLTIMFACMHRLSELARYEPLTLVNHFNLSQNWLLTEFIKGAPMEFIDQIACEITNQNFMQPAVRYPS